MWLFIINDKNHSSIIECIIARQSYKNKGSFLLLRKSRRMCVCVCLSVCLPVSETHESPLFKDQMLVKTSRLNVERINIFICLAFYSKYNIRMARGTQMKACNVLNLRALLD